jgi:hypothetical protein
MVIAVASIVTAAIFPLLFFGVALVAILIIISNTKKARAKSRYQPVGHRRYVTGQFSKQQELDMRLPYRRFKQLYPQNTWTYKEYKKMQMQTAFRRSTSSQQNKRMVR